MSRMEIMNETWELVDMIRESDSLKKLKKLRDDIEHDQKVKAKIKDFEAAKKKYYETREYGEHHPDLKDATEHLVAAKSKLYNDQKVKKYKEVENDVQNLLNEISNKIKTLTSANKNCDKK